MSGFDGFPREGTGFFRDLARNNNRDWFQAHKDVYERACRGPLAALVGELDPLGTCRITRINRDMRFAREGGPYKSYIAAGVRGHYLSLSAEGLWVGTGMYRPEPPMLQKLRAAIADGKSGPALSKVVNGLRRKGYDIETHESVASAPRGYAADHPRIDLLRMKDIYAAPLRAGPRALEPQGARGREEGDRRHCAAGGVVAEARALIAAADCIDMARPAPASGPRCEGVHDRVTPGP